MNDFAFTEAFEKACRKEYASSATDDQWILFWESCKARNLIPGKHVVFRLQKTSVFSAALQEWVKEDRVVLITTVEAMTLIADRTGKYDGQRPVVWHYAIPEQDGKFIESKIPLGRICHAASVEILRKDWKEPMMGTARYDACVQKTS